MMLVLLLAAAAPPTTMPSIKTAPTASLPPTFTSAPTTSPKNAPTISPTTSAPTTSPTASAPTVSPTTSPTISPTTTAPTTSPAGQFRVVTTGFCSDPIRTIAECSAAAAALRLSDVTAQFDGQGSVSYDPVGCYFEDATLKFNDGHGCNTGSCTTSAGCPPGTPPPGTPPLLARPGPRRCRLLHRRPNSSVW